MTQKPLRSPRAALFIGAALLSTPAFAQDSQVTPPPVVSTVPAPAPAPAPAPTITIAPSAPIVQSVPETPAATPARAAPRATARPATSTTTRQVTRTTQTTPAPVAAAPAPAAQAPAAAPEAAPAPLTQPEAQAPAAEEAQTQATETAATETRAPAQNPMPIWPWLLVGALIVAGAVIALLMRRRTEYDEVYDEPYEAYEPSPVVAEPLVAAPVAERVIQPRHEPEVARVAPSVALGVGDTIDNEPDPNFSEPVAEAEIHHAEKEDLAGLTANAPVSKRPWLEFGMRPVRAGTSSDEALVELELTIANAGDLPAKDVRISTFMFTDADSSDLEQVLIERGHDATVPPVTIKPGEGTRVDATLAVRKDTLNEHEFSPLVVADARYTMADGSEGRTSATFRVGLWGDSERLEPIAFDRPEMHRDVAAELVGKPAHA